MRPLFRSRNTDKSYTQFIVVLAFVTGCTALGLQVGKSFEDKLVYSYGVHTSVQKHATFALQNPGAKLTSAEGREILKMADSGKVLLDLAQTADQTGQVDEANLKYTLATTVLEQLQKYLREKGASP